MADPTFTPRQIEWARRAVLGLFALAAVVGVMGRLRWGVGADAVPAAAVVLVPVVLSVIPILRNGRRPKTLVVGAAGAAGFLLIYGAAAVYLPTGQQFAAMLLFVAGMGSYVFQFFLHTAVAFSEQKPEP